LLRYKHYIVSKNISDDVVTSDKFTDVIHDTFEAAYPLKSFINEAINYQLNLDD